MTRRKAFSGTTLSEGQSRDAIERILEAHDVEAIRWTILAERIIIEFKHPEGSFAVAAPFDMADARDEKQQRRQVLRALHWYLKAKFDGIDFGIEDVLKAFMPYLITAPNRVLIDDVREARSQQGLGIDVPLLPEGR
jgi:hypothetical protein